MNILLSEDYRISSDSYQFILQKARVNKKEDSENFGKVVWTSVSYHTTLENLMKSCLNSVFAGSEEQVTLKELQVLFEEVLESFVTKVPESLIPYKTLVKEAL